MKDKVILTDVDGVLFDWIYHFERWLINEKKIKIDDTHPGYMESYRIHERYNLPKESGYAPTTSFSRAPSNRHPSLSASAIRPIRMPASAGVSFV
jgi:FMN phosphatase YigB (HAD superfamily)